MRRVVVVCLAVVLAAASLYPLLALARHVAVTDGDDSRGALDISRVEVDGGRRQRFTISTYGGWNAAAMWDYGYFFIRLDTFGDRRFDKYVMVRSNGYGMEATLWRDRKRKRDVQMASLEEWRPSERSITVRIPLEKLGVPDARTYYRWRVQSLYASGACPQVCFDFAPNRGAVREPLGPEPQPTPTVTISPTPTLTPTPTTTPTPIP